MMIGNEESRYRITKDGMVYDKRNNKFLKPFTRTEGRVMCVRLHKHGTTKVIEKSLPVLMIRSFAPWLYGYTYSYKDGNRTNCAIDNIVIAGRTLAEHRNEHFNTFENFKIRG